jgi:hypothetical protein
VEIDGTHSIERCNVYTLEGQGGTIGLLAGPDGVLMVDARFAPLGDKIVAAIQQISDRRIRFLINDADDRGSIRRPVVSGVEVGAAEPDGAHASGRHFVRNNRRRPFGRVDLREQCRVSGPR